MMNIEDFRDYCLSLPGVTEATPFEKFSRGRFTILVFYVSGHMFCYFNIDDFSQVTVKCDPARIVELKEAYQAVGDPYNGNKKHWISVHWGQDLTDDEILALVKDSYNLVSSKKKTNN